METSENPQSLRDANWHPRHSSEDLAANEKLEARIMAFLRHDKKQHPIGEDPSRPEPILDDQTKAEVETGIIAHFPGERMEKLFDKELDQEFEQDPIKKVRKGEYVSRSLKAKILDFLGI